MTVVETSKELVLLRPLVFGVKSLGFGSMLPLLRTAFSRRPAVLPVVIVDHESPSSSQANKASMSSSSPPSATSGRPQQRRTRQRVLRPPRRGSFRRVRRRRGRPHRHRPQTGRPRLRPQKVVGLIVSANRSSPASSESSSDVGPETNKSSCSPSSSTDAPMPNMSTSSGRTPFERYMASLRVSVFYVRL